MIAEQNGRREQGSGGGGGRFDFAYFSDDVLRDYADQAVHQALINLEARPAPAGNMTRGARPGLARRSCCTRRSATAWRATSTARAVRRFAGRIGQRVAAKGVTVVDDGTIADRRGSLNVDDEGNPTQRNVLIEDGILKGYMQDSAERAPDGRAGPPATAGASPTRTCRCRA